MKLLERALRHLFFTGKSRVGKTSVACANPEAAARAYRERLVGPYRGGPPDAAVRSIEEQLSGARTVEIAAFDEFSTLLGDDETTADFDHVVFDTAHTGHTIHLLELPAAWTKPFAWVINQSLTPLAVTDPVLRQRRALEARYLHEVLALTRRTVLVPWMSDATAGVASLERMSVQTAEVSI